MTWQKDELRPFKIGVKQKRRKGKREVVYQEKKHILAPYDRILCQLIAEDNHGDIDPSHEAVRRRIYAQRVLDEFAIEFTSFKGQDVEFRSRVLTPILQRQLNGIPDAYLPYVSRAIGRGIDHPTLSQAANFYMGVDPTNPCWIPTYRYNMVFIPEMRWHLGIVMKAFELGDGSGFNKVRVDQDELGSGIEKDCNWGAGSGVPRFTVAMARVVRGERLHAFFDQELRQVVRLS